jgi:hypothetical protein
MRHDLTEDHSGWNTAILNQESITAQTIGHFSGVAMCDGTVECDPEHDSVSPGTQSVGSN